MAECSESIGRSQASGLAAGRRIVRGPAGGTSPGQRHDQVAARDQRLLVGGGDDLAGAERREHRAQAHDAARADDDQVHVVAASRARTSAGRRSTPDGRSRRGGIAEPLRRPRWPPAGRLGARPVARATTRNRSRRRAEDVDSLAADAAGRTEDRDARAAVAAAAGGGLSG